VPEARSATFYILPSALADGGRCSFFRALARQPWLMAIASSATNPPQLGIFSLIILIEATRWQDAGNIARKDNSSLNQFITFVDEVFLMSWRWRADIVK
jgi:hypothetical protein